jgi:hypothetical protein
VEKFQFFPAILQVGTIPACGGPAISFMGRRLTASACDVSRCGTTIIAGHFHTDGSRLIQEDSYGPLHRATFQGKNEDITLGVDVC